MAKRFEELKERQRKDRDGEQWQSDTGQNAGLRVHRALSWLKAAEESSSDDIKFITLWISFNALYGDDTVFAQKVLSDRATFKKFFTKVVLSDKHKHLSLLVWEKYSQLIKHFIEIPYTYGAFWEYQRKTLRKDEYKTRFEASKKAAQDSLAPKDTATFLGLVFDRLYVVRNQLMHGGATFESRINREQLKLGSDILVEIIPILIEIMMDDIEGGWGVPTYKPVEDAL